MEHSNLIGHFTSWENIQQVWAKNMKQLNSCKTESSVLIYSKCQAVIGQTQLYESMMWH